MQIVVIIKQSITQFGKYEAIQICFADPSSPTNQLYKQVVDFTPLLYHLPSADYHIFGYGVSSTRATLSNRSGL